MSFIDVPRFGGRGVYSFQIILKADGLMALQYLTMDEPLDSATIGIQNEDGSQGLTILHNGSGLQLHDELAVQIGFVPGEHIVTFQAKVSDTLPLETAVKNKAAISDGRGGTIPVSAIVRVNTVDLSGSALTVDRGTALPSQHLRYTVTLRNVGTGEVPTAAAVVPIPANTAYVDGSATGGATLRAEPPQVEWAGPVPANGQVSFSFDVSLDLLLADGTPIAASATLSDGLRPPFTRDVTTLVQAPDLSQSDKRVTPSQPSLGQTVTYDIEVKNTGSRQAAATLSDPLPAGVQYVDGSAWAGSGTVDYDAGTRSIHWAGAVPAKGIAVITFQAQVLEQGADPESAPAITNSVTINDGLGRLTTKRASLRVGMARVLLPLVLKK